MPTPQQLQKAVSIAEKIQDLQNQLDAILGTPSKKSAKAAAIIEDSDFEQVEPKKRGPKPGSKRGRKKKAKRVMSDEARAKIAEAQKRRWAKVK